MSEQKDVQASDTASSQQTEYLSFRIRDSEYSVEIMSVREIRGWTRTTSLPHAPPFVRGVINLRGTVLPVGGIKEKAVAALRSGIRRMLLPSTNVTDIELLPEEVRHGVDLIPVETMDQVLREALVQTPARQAVEDDLTGGLGMQVS